MKYITIFADASFDHKTKAAGIAMWARDDVRTSRASKSLSFPVESNTIAETLALGMGILMALKEFSVNPGDRLSIQSDCLHALNVFTNRKADTEIEAGMLGQVMNAITQAGVTLHPKHVKGHAGGGTARSAVNQWCDIQARTQMRKSRAAICEPLF